MDNVQEQGHPEGHDYAYGSPHLKHPQLRSMIERHLAASVAQQLRLPSSLRALSISGHYFNQPVSQLVLPARLESLSLAGAGFDQPLEGLALPSGLRVLDLSGREFDQPIQQLVLPPRLEVLRQAVRLVLRPSTLHRKVLRDQK